MKANQGTILFLLASFISSLGDYVLLYSVPAGLGLDTADIRSAVSMWLIPAVAMYLSSYLSHFITKRELTSKTDLGKLYLAIGVLEITFAILAFFCTSKLQVLVTVCFFVFFYAFAKEGIPKLFYMVSIYRYFVSPTNYTKLASTNAGLGVLASILGTLLAGGLLATGNWKFGLLVDAATFFIFGVIVIFYGTDVIKGQEEAVHGPHEFKHNEDTPIALNGIYLILPLFFCINAISWNYLPLLGSSLDIASVANSIYFIALLRAPGLFLGLRYTTIFRNLRSSTIITIVSLFYFLSIFVFLIRPSIAFFAITVLAQGLFSGVYWPTDLAVRNQLASKPQILFNTSVLKSLSSFQFICLLALLLFEDPQASMAKLPFIFFGVSMFVWVFQSYEWRQLNKALGINQISK